MRSDPEVISTPSPDAMTATRIGRFIGWLGTERGVRVSGWDELWRWSVTDLDGFWAAVWDFHGVRSSTGYRQVLGDRGMPGAQWFPGARLNYAEHALRAEDMDEDGDRPALIGYSQTRAPMRLTVRQLRAEVGRAQRGLRRLGVGPGDRVVAYLPNIPETVIAFLATAGLGAVWASCAPEFGARAVLDRFGQIEPGVLLVVGGYRYGDKPVDRRAEVAAIRAGLPTARHVVGVRYGGFDVPDAVAWDDLLAGEERYPEPSFEQVPFDHPLCVLFSSGTTGVPKAIVHGQGGILLEHLKNHSLSWDLGPGDTLLWFSTTAWMMWNCLVSALLVGAAAVLIDGNPLHPDLSLQWRLAGETGATVMGASPGFLMACRAAGLRPAREFDLSRLRQLAVAGSPLPPEGYRWVREQFGSQVLLNVGSGGTDVCTGLVQGSPMQPVWAGEISGAGLGVAATAFDATGRELVGELGELVVTEPMPSMPVRFWGDDDGQSRYRAAYFGTYPGVWRHGDWVRFTPRGSCTVEGRSDATLNRGGVRLGTAEFYRVVEELPEIEDSLVVHLEDAAGGNGELLLYVALRPGHQLDGALVARLRAVLRGELSPRHVPDAVHQVPAVPRNRTGKKLEVPVKQILRGRPADDVLGPDVLADPDSLAPFLAQARDRRADA